MNKTHALGYATLTSLALLTGCGAAQQSGPPSMVAVSSAPSSSSGSAGYAAPAPTAPPSYSSASASVRSSAPAPSAGATGGITYGGAGGSEGYAPHSAEPPPESRPGLATQWGETRYNPLGYAPFVRSNPSVPFATAAIRYNDAQGATAQAWYRAQTVPPVQYIGAYNGGVHISIRDENNNPLPGQLVGDALYVIGNVGQRYEIVVQNTTPLRFEAVASVDGLDVINGRSADLTNRGYILDPYGTLTIDGFRQDHSNVAAFRFGSVGDSYAAQTGSARNVGVVGVALFTEQGAVIQPVPSNEVQLRETANPFPGQFATPPPRRYYP
jgi:hypothetical protein